MTVSTHVYSAWLMTSPEVELSVRGGRITLDAGASPHVQGTIEIARPAEAILEALDPRDSVRVRVEVDGEYPSFSVHREFDLGLRDRGVRHADGTVSLSLSSDEALLEDFAPLADDWTPRTYSASLRAVIDYVLSKVDTNLQINSSAATDTTGWGFTSSLPAVGTLTRITGVVGASSTTAFRATSGGGHLVFSASSHPVEFPVVAGATYTARAELRTNTTRTVSFQVVWRNSSHAFLSQTTAVTATPGANVWVTLERIAVAPVGAAYGYVSASVTGGTATAGDTLDVTSVRVTKGLNPGTEDADVTPYWALTNLFTNPDMDANITGYLSGSGSTVISYNAGAGVGGSAGFLRGTQSAATGAIYLCPGATSGYTVTPGATYTLALSARHSVAAAAMTITFRWYNADNVLLKSTVSPSTALPTTWSTVFSQTAEAPAGATKLVPFVSISGSASTRTWDLDRLILVQDNELPEWFDGNHPATGYTASWADAANASTSEREPLVDRPRAALLWRAGQSAMDFLHPLVQAAGYRLVCDENRNWTLRDESYTASGSVAIRHAVNLIEGDDTISRDSGIWFDSAVTTYTWTDSNGVEQIRTDAYALAEPYTRLRTFQKTTAYPGPGFSEYAVRRAQQRGREVTVTSVADWRANAEQPATVVLADTPTQTGNTQSVEFDLSNDRMSVTLRSTDTPDLAWVLGPDDLNWTEVTPALTWAAMDEWTDA